MSARLEAHGIRLTTKPDGRKMAYVSIHVTAADGGMKFEIGVPDSGSTQAILEDVRDRLLRLFRSLTVELEDGPIHLAQ